MNQERTIENLDAIFDYLDGLRESGSINMFSAAPYIAEEFGLNRQQSKQALSSWMATFSERHGQ